MNGQNLFGTFNLHASVHGPSSPCVFISHKSEDKPMARAVAAILLDLGVNIYFDENDVDLQTAHARGDDATMVHCIERGLDHSTHLLGLITPRTFKSWWIPYEIGGATGRKRNCCHLVAKEVTQLPSYVKIAPIILDTDGLAAWIDPSIPGAKGLMKTAAIRVTKSFSAFTSFVPQQRSASEITYY